MKPQKTLFAPVALSLFTSALTASALTASALTASALTASANAQNSAMPDMKMSSQLPITATSSTRSLRESPPTLPTLPRQLPRWLDTKSNHEIFYKRGAYNFAIYEIPALARDMNGVAVGHSMAYEALVTGRANQLETRVFDDIDRVLKNPPRWMPTEKSLSPTFAQKYGALETVFDWTHVSHAQTIDNFISTKADNAAKDQETDAVWNFYKTANAPFVVTGLPMNMAWLDSQPYSGAFRQKYPKVNALFWGYHWLQTAIYDGLRGKNQSEQKQMYAMLGNRYRAVELYDTRRPFMPMMAETSPLFSAQYPEIANAFDNLHMLHDMVGDIIASDWMSETQKREQIKRAVFIMSPDAHKNCKAGENRGVIDGVSHDHRFMDGMPGMGIMKNGLQITANPVAQTPINHDMSDMERNTSSTRSLVSHVETRVSAHIAENSESDGAKSDAKTELNPTELMWMPQLGWMNMSQCHHCSMPLPGNGDDKNAAWRASTVFAEGWTMRVRCALCARDMSSETKGGAILSLATENPNVRITVFADEKGNFTTQHKGAVFLEENGNHARCSQWSQAFTSRKAFDTFAKENPKFADAKPLSFAEWANVAASKTPETYVQESGPVENPYADDLRKRGIEVGEQRSTQTASKANELSADEAALAALSVTDDTSNANANTPNVTAKSDELSDDEKALANLSVNDSVNDDTTDAKAEAKR